LYLAILVIQSLSVSLFLPLSLSITITSTAPTGGGGVRMNRYISVWSVHDIFMSSLFAAVPVLPLLLLGNIKGLQLMLLRLLLTTTTMFSLVTLMPLPPDAAAVIDKGRERAAFFKLQISSGLRFRKQSWGNLLC
jgi:hypothetical protein